MSSSGVRNPIEARRATTQPANRHLANHLSRWEAKPLSGRDQHQVQGEDPHDIWHVLGHPFQDMDKWGEHEPSHLHWRTGSPNPEEPQGVGYHARPHAQFQAPHPKTQWEGPVKKQCPQSPGWQLMGYGKETLITTYNPPSKSLFDYCCPIWTPSLNDTSRSELQTNRNSAPRTV